MTRKGKKHTFKKNDLIDSIIRMRIDKGMTRVNILDCLQKDLGLSKSYSYELMADASKEFDNRSIQNFGKDIKEDIERFEMLYQKAVLGGNMKEAREVLKEISKLKGHYTERIELSGEITYKAKFDDL
jgi:predicted Zn-dependent protease